MVGSTSQSVIRSVSPFVLIRLSGLEYFFVAMCCNVGMPLGKAMLSS